jgi:hypothetical protein
VSIPEFPVPPIGYVIEIQSYKPRYVARSGHHQGLTGQLVFARYFENRYMAELHARSKLDVAWKVFSVKFRRQ